MMDACVVLRQSSLPDEYGRNKSTMWSEVLVSACGIGPQSRREILASAQVPTSNFTVRLPIDIGAQIRTTDRIQLTHRDGAPLLLQELYEVQGPPHVGRTGSTLDVRLIGDPQ